MKLISQEDIKRHDKKLNKNLAKEMMNPYYFLDTALKVGFNITLDSQHINHANFILTIQPSCSEIQTRLNEKKFREITTIYARSINQCNFIHETVFSTRCDKQNGDGQMLDEIELFNTFRNNRTLTQYNIDIIKVRFQLEHQIKSHEMKDK